ncbi:YceI family protein [Syntrophomonas wolfei]|uniref:Uncharacterized protein n=1 Tax=Syntrophomonas wolfei subsp. wolfei (strain DSM 2245B / Goettingen) TaxID=335541 RepID=Q0AXY0_SYNWW|nr:YceI family protein [Syntrophomonas wolfei]ABI68424.1 hypothetical protein Swol_1114 [Syntrophomonas wolfei subsp. wolfei str. Goettingen G311]
MQRILLITACTGSKTYRPDDALRKEDFLDAERFKEKSKKLNPYLLPAGKMYTGAQHLRLNEGVLTLRKKYGDETIDVYILSAGYGLISEDYPVWPYEITFNKMNKGKYCSGHNSLKSTKKRRSCCRTMI